ncbi:4-(cytidine 5'-diphospho)-2-C-methyl-D-erythritol kinase [Candidatus Curtissbacteria bacterium RBG_13_35_7]|uniref:4-diphosphocytidyl-2-C-methyl-D-erythritol kinase n=1 Tax=Candidatus Curtissbacteria bacterium RBG_13_35_7 TaxID=1797705 RepID=A0A1F5G3L6_9BACT|nr:MAG: 4-(cytidine 5'-diphospho)-2-C-methyl-D-erythritol kinase [Candidatus Curtissbacteria bacterium RBG_13_35_7]
MINLRAYAKLDLAIHINPKKSRDNYYPVDYLDCQINLFDTLCFKPINKDIKLICNNPKVPKNKSNFIYKAAYFLKEKSNIKNLGTIITLEKNIPIKAGFGGGSSNAAAAIIGLAKLWKIRLTKQLISDLSKYLGKDFYYSYYGGLAEVKGIGKNYKLAPLPAKSPKFYLLIIIPKKEKPSTCWIYQHLKKSDIGKNLKKYQALKKSLIDKNKNAIIENLHNDFENSVIFHFPVVGKIKQDLIKSGANQALLAGAGLSVVGFFTSQKDANLAKQKLTNKYKQTIISQTI